MKRNIILIIIIILAASLAISTLMIAYADEQDPTEVNDLGGYYLAEFSYKSIVHKNGSLERTFEVIIDDNYLLSQDYLDLIDNEQDEPLNEIANIFETLGYVTTLTSSKMTASYTYESLTDYYIAIEYNGFKKEVNDSDVIIGDKNLLYSYYNIKQKTIFNDIKREELTDDNTIGKVVLLLDYYGIDIQYINFKYVYGTVYNNNKINSNADTKYKDDSLSVYLHEFNMDITNNENPIVLINRVPNFTIWYGGAILAGIAIALLPLLIALIKRRRI